MKKAEDCQNIQEVRNAIDTIDYQIMELFGERFKYVEKIVNFKNDKDGIVAKDRQEEVLKNRRLWAEKFNLNPDLFEQIYDTLIQWNIRKEMEIFSDKDNK